MSPAYYLAEDGRGTGPHSLAVLAQKAEVHAIHPDSLVYPVDAPDGSPWLPIHQVPDLHAHLFPARSLPSLGVAQFDSANAESDASVSPFTIDEALRENTARQRAAEGELLKDFGPRPNNRRRDFVVCTIGLNLFCLLMGFLISFHNPFLIGLFAMGNVSIVWVLYGVMDRY